MDNTQLGDLGAVIGALSRNPEALSALGSIMGSLNKKPSSPEKGSFDASGLLSLLGGGRTEEKPTELISKNPFGSKEDIKNRIALLNAVKPFLSNERQEKLELVIKLLKLSELGELTSLLGKLS